jgi:8-oxo-dGTP diphosphatase
MANISYGAANKDEEFRQARPNACSIALIDDDRVFLIQRAYPPFANLWTLPGGRREAGETPEECVRRELFEETGLLVDEPVPVLVEAIGEGGRKFILAVFAAKHLYAAPVVSDEVADWDWVDISELSRYECTENLAEIVGACADMLRLSAERI